MTMDNTKPQLLEIIGQREARISTLEQEAEQLRQYPPDPTEEIEGLTDQVETLTQERDEAVQYRTDTEPRVQGLNDQVETLTTERDDSREYRTRKDAEVEGLTSQVETLTTERDESREYGTIKDAEVEGLNDKVSTLTTERDESLEYGRTKDGEVVELTGQVETLTGERDESREYATELEGRIGIADGRLARIDESFGGLSYFENGRSTQAAVTRVRKSVETNFRSALKFADQGYYDGMVQEIYSAQEAVAERGIGLDIAFSDDISIVVSQYVSRKLFTASTAMIKGLDHEVFMTHIDEALQATEQFNKGNELNPKIYTAIDNFVKGTVKIGNDILANNPDANASADRYFDMARNVGLKYQTGTNIQH